VSAVTFAALLRTFFTDRLLRQMRASPNTVAGLRSPALDGRRGRGYRDAFRLLIRYTTDRTAKGTVRPRARGSRPGPRDRLPRPPRGEVREHDENEE